MKITDVFLSNGVWAYAWETDLATCGPCGPSCLFLCRHGDHVTSLHCDKLVCCCSGRLLLAGYCGNHLLLLLCWNFPRLLLDNNLHVKQVHMERTALPEGPCCLESTTGCKYCSCYYCWKFDFLIKKKERHNLVINVMHSDHVHLFFSPPTSGYRQHSSEKRFAAQKQIFQK